MTNPDYQVTTKNIDIWNNINNDVSINELSKQGHKLKDIDMLLKGKEVRKYLEAQKAAEPKLGMYEKMHERTESGQISEIMEDLYIRGNDIYKMTIKEWTKKIPEYFAGGGSVSGFATGGISNLFRERQGFKVGELITGGIKLAKGARWLIRMLKEMMDDMIYGQKQFAKMTEALKMKYFKETEAAVKHLEAGGEIPGNLIQTLRQDARFQGLTVSKTGGKDFIEIQEVVLGKLPKGKGEIIEGKAVDESKFPLEMRKYMGRPLKDKDFKAIEKGTGEKIIEGTVADEELELWGFMDQLPKELQHKVALLPIEKQIPLLKKFKEAVDAVKTGGTEKGIEVLQEQLLKDFIPKGQPHATGGLIDGYATGGVSNLFRQRYRGGKAVELVTKLPEFLKFVERLLIKASNEIRRGQGKWKDLDIKQKIVQHDNLTKLVTEFQKTKKFNPGMNEYFGINAEKAFIEAQAEVKEIKILEKFKPSGEPNAEGGLIPGYATGGVSNLFRSR